MWIQRGGLAETVDCSQAAGGTRAAQPLSRLQVRPYKEPAVGGGCGWGRQLGPRHLRTILPPVGASQNGGGGQPEEEGIGSAESNAGWFHALQSVGKTIMGSITRKKGGGSDHSITEEEYFRARMGRDICYWDMLVAAASTRTPTQVYNDPAFYQSFDPAFYCMPLEDERLMQRLGTVGPSNTYLETAKGKLVCLSQLEKVERLDARYKGWTDHFRSRPMLFRIEALAMRKHISFNTRLVFSPIGDGKARAQTRRMAKEYAVQEPKKGFGLKSNKAPVEKKKKEKKKATPKKDAEHVVPALASKVHQREGASVQLEDQEDAVPFVASDFNSESKAESDAESEDEQLKAAAFLEAVAACGQHEDAETALAAEQVPGHSASDEGSNGSRESSSDVNRDQEEKAEVMRQVAHRIAAKAAVTFAERVGAEAAFEPAESSLPAEDSLSSFPAEGSLSLEEASTVSATASSAGEQEDYGVAEAVTEVDAITVEEVTRSTARRALGNGQFGKAEVAEPQESISDSEELGTMAAEVAPNDRLGETVQSDVSTSEVSTPAQPAGVKAGRGRRSRVARVARPQGSLWSVCSRERTAPRHWEAYDDTRGGRHWQPSWKRPGGAGYIDSTLKFPERLQWKAAGVLLYMFREHDNEMMMLLACSTNRPRDKAAAWNVLGGKRKSTDSSAEATAVREMTEESGGLLSGYDIIQEQLQTVLWAPCGNYALFLQQLPLSYLHLPERYAKMQDVSGPRPSISDPTDLAWVPLSDLTNPKKRKEFHHFLITTIRDTELLPWLKRQQWEYSRSTAPLQQPPLGPSNTSGASSSAPARTSLRGRSGSPNRDPLRAAAWHARTPLRAQDPGKRRAEEAHPASGQWQASNITPLRENELQRPNPPPPLPLANTPVQARGRRKFTPKKLTGKEYKRDETNGSKKSANLQDHDRVALEAILSTQTTGVVMAEVYNNGVTWNPQQGTPSTPSRVAYSSRIAAIEAYPKASKGSLRVFDIHQGRLRESIEDRRSRPYSGKKKAEARVDTSALLASSLMSATASFLPTVEPPAKTFSKDETADFTSILFPASSLDCLPEPMAAAPFRSEEERDREVRRVWLQPDDKALNRKNFLSNRARWSGRSIIGPQAGWTFDEAPRPSGGGGGVLGSTPRTLNTHQTGDGTTWYGKSSNRANLDSPGSSGSNSRRFGNGSGRASSPPSGGRSAWQALAEDEDRRAWKASAAESKDGDRTAWKALAAESKDRAGSAWNASAAESKDRAGIAESAFRPVRRKVVVKKVGHSNRKPLRRK